MIAPSITGTTLQGPGTRSAVVGPDGSSIVADAPGGVVSTSVDIGYAAHAAPIVAYAAPAAISAYSAPIVASHAPAVVSAYSAPLVAGHGVYGHGLGLIGARYGSVIV